MRFFKIIMVLCLIFMLVFSLCGCEQNSTQQAVSQTEVKPATADEAATQTATDSDNLTVSEDEFFEYILKDGNLYINGYSSTAQVLNVPSSYSGQDVYGISAQAFQNREFVKVNLPESVKSVGSLAFEGCENLLEITILNDDIEIDPSAFSGVENITIKAYKGSAAKDFADEYDYDFKKINK